MVEGREGCRSLGNWNKRRNRNNNITTAHGSESGQFSFVFVSILRLSKGRRGKHVVGAHRSVSSICFRGDGWLDHMHAWKRGRVKIDKISQKK